MMLRFEKKKEEEHSRVVRYASGKMLTRAIFFSLTERQFHARLRRRVETVPLSEE